MTQETKKKLRDNRAVLGLRRKAHFESGGDPATWRGRPNVFTDKKKKKNKQACRKPIKKNWQGEY